jgi:hypothetical protein
MRRVFTQTSRAEATVDPVTMRSDAILIQEIFLDVTTAIQRFVAGAGQDRSARVVPCDGTGHDVWAYEPGVLRRQPMKRPVRVVGGPRSTLSGSAHGRVSGVSPGWARPCAGRADLTVVLQQRMNGVES